VSRCWPKTSLSRSLSTGATSICPGQKIQLDADVAPVAVGERAEKQFAAAARQREMLRHLGIDHLRVVHTSAQLEEIAPAVAEVGRIIADAANGLSKHTNRASSRNGSLDPGALGGRLRAPAPPPPVSP